MNNLFTDLPIDDRDDWEDPDPERHYERCGKNYDCCQYIGDCAYWLEHREDLHAGTLKPHILEQHKRQQLWQAKSAEDDLKQNPNNHIWDTDTESVLDLNIKCEDELASTDDESSDDEARHFALVKAIVAYHNET